MKSIAWRAVIGCMMAFVIAAGVPGMNGPALARDNAAAELAGGESPTGPAPPVNEAAITSAVQAVKAGDAAMVTADQQILYDNGPLVNSPGTGVGGADESVLQTSLGMNTLGFGNQFTNGYRMADDFEVTGGPWRIRQIHFFAYQTNAATDPSTMTGIYLQIWDGPPNDPASGVVWGDLTTNRLTASSWSGIYRVSETSPLATNRPVMRNIAAVDVTLEPGTYWLDWTTDGTLALSGPWAPPITITGQTTTGNALQFTAAWAEALDTGTATQQGMPFTIYGDAGKYPWIIMLPAATSGAGR